MERSIYAGKLIELGFDEWDDENVESLSSDSLLEGSLPAFLCVRLGNLEITFVVDELSVLWAAKGSHDLSFLGFNELMPEEEGPARSIH